MLHYFCQQLFVAYTLAADEKRHHLLWDWIEALDCFDLLVVGPTDADSQPGDIVCPLQDFRTDPRTDNSAPRLASSSNKFCTTAVSTKVYQYQMLKPMCLLLSFSTIDTVPALDQDIQLQRVKICWLKLDFWITQQLWYLDKMKPHSLLFLSPSCALAC